MTSSLCSYPRNFAFPPNASPFEFENTTCGSTTSSEFTLHDNVKDFLSEDTMIIAQALKSRFDKLPIHKICYQHHNRPTGSVLRKIRRIVRPSRSFKPWRLPTILFGRDRSKIISSGKEQDFIGMTPLHILCTSTKHSLELYELLIELYPENLITKDAWGSSPLLYAFWNNAPSEVIQLLVDKHKSLYPNHEIDWIGMIETMGRSRYSLDQTNRSLISIEKLLCIQQNDFPDCTINWQEVVTRWATEDSKQGLACKAQRFHKDTFQYLVTFSLSTRLNSLGSEKWKRDVQNDIDTSHWFVNYRKKSSELIYSKVEHYEYLNELKEASSLLELALWKSSIDSLPSTSSGDGEKMTSCRDREKEECLIKCGANVVVPNVLSFLLPST